MLPTYRKFDDRPSRPRRYLLYLTYLVKNYTLLFISGLAITVLLWRMFSPFDRLRTPQHPLPTPLPPIYSRHHNELMNLPQHRWQNDKLLPFERFFYVSGHGRGMSPSFCTNLYPLVLDVLQHRDGMGQCDGGTSVQRLSRLQSEPGVSALSIRSRSSLT